MLSFSRSDATPAYRGYRLQTLYTLARIFEPGDTMNQIFQPEGEEDLAVFDVNKNLVEVVQVKAYGNNLSLSSLSPNKEDSFFYRVNNLLKNAPDLKISIVSFGTVGEEILNATQTDGSHRKSVAQKLSKKGFLSEVEARKLISHIQIISVQEAELVSAVYESMRNCLIGVEPERAFEMLNYWLYLCAENKTEITQRDVIEKVSEIGQFIHERAAHHQEWFTSIAPIINSSVETQKDKLSSEFYRGVSARYEHIIADVDKRRNEKLSELYRKFKQNNIVIIHGASGQGKTTLAYRYLHDFFPDYWRFQIQLVENRQHAVSIATALSGHAKAIGIPIVVYLDISPNDIGWVELLKKLALIPNISVLVTVREEDFRRASISGAEIQFAEIDLAFERAEAQEIYDFLTTTVTPSEFLNFDDAWDKFGGSGPLLEFVYLITQGALLRERLSQQVERLEDEVRKGKYSASELELLRLVAVASAFESRLKIHPLVQHFKLSAPQRTFELLEKEYLIRRSANGFLVDGLHPIRSSILAEILTDPIFSPWSESASNCLPFIFEQDIESFLLHAFLRNKTEIQPLLKTLDSYQPNSWVAIASVVRALIWLGIKDYVDVSKPLIKEAYAAFSNAWLFILDFDIADVSTGLSDSLLKNLSVLLSQEQQQQIKAIINRQTEKKIVFKYVENWLKKRTHKPVLPKNDTDWSGLAETLFWVGRLKINFPVQEWLYDINLNNLVNTLPINILADLALGLFYSCKEIYVTWMSVNFSYIVRRFRQETNTIVLEDDGYTIKAHFFIEVYQADTIQINNQQKKQKSEKRLIDEATERIDLLGGLFPNRDVYACKGYGHNILTNELPYNYDDTEKNIPRSNLHIQWLVSVNSTFNALTKQIFRPNTWEDYANVIFDVRQVVIQSLHQLKSGLEIHFRKQKQVNLLGNLVNANDWEQCKQLLHKPPELPLCAFDNWGFVTDENSQLPDVRVALRNNKGLALKKYNNFLSAFNEYHSKLYTFFDKASLLMILNPHLRDATNFKAKEIANQSDTQQSSRLSIINLVDTYNLLLNFQEEFRELFSKFLDVKKLNSLDVQENQVFQDLWHLWYFFVFNPNRRLQNPKKKFAEELDKKLKRVKNNLRKELSLLSTNEITINLVSKQVSWDNDKALWLIVDGEDATNVYNSLDSIIPAIRRAVNTIENIELRRYVLEFHFSCIVIVPLVKGKSLNATACRISLINFLFGSDEIGWWHFVPNPIPANFLRELEITTWTLPRLEIANNLQSSIGQLTSLAFHIQDFKRIEKISDLDEQGHELLQQYMQLLATPMSEVFQLVLDTETEIAEFFNKLPASEQASRLHLLTALQLLVELHKLIMPTDDFQNQVRMDLEEIVNWASQLKTAQQYAFLTYLSLVSDVLEEFCTPDQT